VVEVHEVDAQGCSLGLRGDVDSKELKLTIEVAHNPCRQAGSFEVDTTPSLLPSLYSLVDGVAMLQAQSNNPTCSELLTVQRADWMVLIGWLVLDKDTR
jgi:hypothetical protein